MSDFNDKNKENTSGQPQSGATEGTQSGSQQQRGGYSGGDPSQNTGWTSAGSSTNYQDTHTESSQQNASQQPSGGAAWQQNGWNNGGGYQQDGGYQNPYSGYRNPSQQGDLPQNNEPYQWNFEEYDNAKSKKQRRKNSGAKIVGIFAGCVAGLAILSLAGIGGWYMVTGGIIDSVTTQSSTPTVVESSQAQQSSDATVGNSSGLTLTDRPSSQSTQPVEGEPLSTPDIADKVKPSVVGILNYSNTGSSVQAILTPSEGSGIIMSEDGFILTNAHVVSDAVGLKVVLEDGSEYEARIVGLDELTDIAVIKVDATGLPYAEFGNSDQLRVGEKVVAIGNPRGLTLAGSVTQGIVSAVNRTLSNNGSDITYIQTDAAINPGNSGGALVNEYGQVIGINTAKIAQNAGSDTIYEGIGFAIPISEAKPIIDDLKAYGRVTGRVRLGVTVRTVDSYTAAIYQVPQGAMVASTEEGSDIAAKGVIAGDIIYSVDGQAITSTNELKAAIMHKKPGDTVRLGIYRYTGGYGAREFEVDVELMEDTTTAATTIQGNG